MGLQYSRQSERSGARQWSAATDYIPPEDRRQRCPADRGNDQVARRRYLSDRTHIRSSNCAMWGSVSEFTKNKTSVCAAETERIGNSDIDITFTGNIWHVIKIASFTRVIKINGWRYDPVAEA
jgi:hypothetical protein